MKKQMVGALAALLLEIIGCKTITVDSVKGASVKADEEVKPVPAEVQTHVFNDWFKKGKEITVSKTGYAPASLALKTKMEDKVYVPLSRLFNIYANEEGATVYVNDETVGVTPLKGVPICDDGKSIVTVKKQGWLEEKMSPNERTATDIMFTLERDASGRHLIDIVPDQNGARTRASSIFSDSDVGEDSPNVAQVRRLTSQPQNEYIQDFSILPDGKSLVASILEVAEKDGRQLKRANLWLLNALVAAAPRRALTTGNFMDINATASSDGETLYFSSTRNGRFAIWSLNMKTMAGLKLITNANTADSSPAIDPEGKNLLYTAVLPGNSNPTYLWSKPADGSGMPSQLREGYDAVWSPDGTKCLYVKGNKENNEADIWMIDANGGNPTQLTVDGVDSNDVDPHWSPDGRRIVFSSNRGQIKGRKNYDIWMMDADGANLTQLTTNGSCDDKPAFGSDGKTIYFRSNRGLVWDIWMMTLAEKPVGTTRLQVPQAQDHGSSIAENQGQHLRSRPLLQKGQMDSSAEGEVRRCQSYLEGQSTERLNITPWLSPKEAVEIFAAYHEKTPFFDGLSTDNRLVFVDLDFDGVLEGLAISCDGTMLNTTYTAYRIDPKTKKLVVLRRTGDRGEDFEYEWRTNGVQLIMDKETGLKRYSVQAFSCESSRMLAYSRDMGHVFMDNGVVRTVDVASVVNYHDKDEDTYQREYRCGGKQVDRVFYDTALSRVYSQYYDLHLTLGEIFYGEVDWGSPEKFRRLLLSAYLAFKYDGFSFTADMKGRKKKLLILAAVIPWCSFAQSEMALTIVSKCEAWKLSKVDAHQSVDTEWHEAGDGTWFTNSVGEKIPVERYCAVVNCTEEREVKPLLDKHYSRCRPNAIRKMYESDDERKDGSFWKNHFTCGKSGRILAGSTES